MASSDVIAPTRRPGRPPSDQKKSRSDILAHMRAAGQLYREHAWEYRRILSIAQAHNLTPDELITRALGVTPQDARHDLINFSLEAPVRASYTT